MASADSSRDEEQPFVGNLESVISKKNHTKDVHILSSAFLLIFLAYGAAQNLETTINTVCTFFFLISFDELFLWYLN